MHITVLKFGGTSVADCKRIESVATIVQKHIQNNEKVVVVVSAMAGFTNQLSDYLKAASPHLLSSPEHDVVLSSGEQITAGLMSLALQAKGFSARSFLGSQIPIQTTSQFGCAHITNIQTQGLLDFIQSGGIPVVPGFQGITTDNTYQQITTLGRGGSDTTAVALSSFLNARDCYIYTDVDGVYSADPRVVNNAFRLPYIDYTTMLSLASKGAKVLHAPCVSWAKESNIQLHILSSFNLEEINQKTIIAEPDPKYQNPHLSSSITYEMYKTICCFKMPSTQSLDILNLWLQKISHEFKIQFSDLHIYNDNVSFYFDQEHTQCVFAQIEKCPYHQNLISDFKLDKKSVILSLVGPAFEQEKIFHKIKLILDKEQIRFIPLSSNTVEHSISINYENFIQTINILHDQLLLN
ncbi:MAG: hypothetical protein C0432_03520 [Candidatus Puniceispirillum sp.]|nr:hypothetical protein [Candidatus Pelagibacter sp.]MBA4283344.1 hypothetical protein [Candidatus Puniceispirillum sp.]